MEITLKSEFEDMIRERLASAGYQTAAAVVEESLRLLKDRDERIRCLDEIARKANLGFEQVENGGGVTFYSAEELLLRVKSGAVQMFGQPA